MRTVSLHTLGCKLNFADTDRLAREFAAREFSVVRGHQAADVTVINSCSVTEEADRKCRQLVRRSLRTNPDTFVIVTGCYAQLQPGALSAIPGVDVVLGMKDKFRIFDVIDGFTKVSKTQVEVSCIDDVRSFESSYSAARTRTFVKVQDGCDYGCSFCTIPMARGRSRSQKIADVVDQVRGLASSEAKEIVLSGVNLGLFGADTGESLLALLEELDLIDGIGRYRISSIEPNLLSDNIVDFVFNSKRFAPHFHIPLQSGDDIVLGQMRRRYRSTLYAGLVHNIVMRCPDVCIGADVIVGFPGETEEQFLNTFHLLESLPVSYLHVFTYSARPNTVAEKRLVEGELSVVEKRDLSRRNALLRGLSEAKRKKFYESQIGLERPVLWEGNQSSASNQPVKGNAEMFGHTDNYVKVRAPLSAEKLRTFETVTLENVEEGDDGVCVRASQVQTRRHSDALS